MLRALKKEELAGFGKHLRSAHGGEQVALKVFGYVKKFYPGFGDGRRLDFNHAYTCIFPEDKKVNDKKLLNILSKLTTWLKQYLLLQETSGRTFENSFFTARLLWEKGLSDEYEKSITDLTALAESSQKESLGSRMNNLSASHLAYFHIGGKDNKNLGGLLEQCNAGLDITYCIGKLKMACEMAKFNTAYNESYDLSETKTIVSLSKKHLEKSLLLQLYYTVFHLITTQKGKYYDEAERILLQHAHKIHDTELHTILIHMRSNSAVRIRMGDETAWQTGHNLNKISHASGFYKKEKMNELQFTNIVNAAVYVGDIAWAWKFMEEQGPLLEKSLRENTLKLAAAIIYSAEKKPEEVLNLVAQISFNDINVNIRTRSLMLKSYYELSKPLEFITSFCSAFKAFLRRKNKLNKQAAEATTNFIKIVQMLINPNKSTQSIQEVINTTQRLYFKKWLTEMCLER